MLLRAIVLLTLGTAAAGCERTMFDPAKATKAYPLHLHRAESINVQVFRDGPHLEIVNSTPVSYADCDVWLNQRFTRRVEAIRAGETVRLSLWDFYDMRGDRFSGGGFWRTERPTPLRLVELQVSDEQPLIGLVTVLEQKRVSRQ